MYLNNVGKNCPLDDYGLSMIAVSVNEDGALSTCTCRWNHDNGGDDKIMTTNQISKVIGRNFYETFKPNNRAEEIKQQFNDLIKNSEDLAHDAWSFEPFQKDLSHIARIQPFRYTQQYIINMDSRTLLQNGQAFNAMKQVTDDNWVKYPFLLVQYDNEDYNILDPLTDTLLLSKPVWFMETFFYDNEHNRLVTIIDNERESYDVYELFPKPQLIRHIPYPEATDDSIAFRTPDIVTAFEIDDEIYYLWKNCELLNLDECAAKLPIEMDIDDDFDPWDD